jgi:hypothetical protein
MNSETLANPASNLVEKSLAAPRDDLSVSRGHLSIESERPEKSARMHRQDSKRGLRLINLERRAHFCRFF